MPDVAAAVDAELVAERLQLAGELEVSMRKRTPATILGCAAGRLRNYGGDGLDGL